jgi:hypothetical protein
MFLLPVLLSCGSPCLPHQFLKPEGKTTELIGVIRLVPDYETSGFEEDAKHDSQVNYWTLEGPVNVQRTPEKPQRMTTP